MNYLLFTTTTCPKCPAFKKFVAENIDFDGEILDETSPDFSSRIAESGVIVAPVILIFENGKEVFRTGEILELQDFLKA